MAYDVGKAFARIEDELTVSMMRNLKYHRAEEKKEGIQWVQWQAEQLKALEKYKAENKKLFAGTFNEINKNVPDVIREAYKQGGMEQEIKILKALQKGYKPRFDGSVRTTGEFLKLNERKLNALINSTVNDLKRAEHAVLRRANDRYRKIIFDAQVYANAGGTTYEKAVDMATNDFLKNGIDCIEYANGARHTISDYADMAIRTANKRAYLRGEGVKRAEWGIHTVIVNKRGNPCPLCLPYVGKVLIDDVYSGGSSKDGNYQLLSTAMADGFLHPRCRDSFTTYFEGVSSPPNEQKITNADISEIEQEEKRRVQLSNAKRQAKRYKRLGKYSLDEDKKKVCLSRAKQWEEKAESLKKPFTSARNGDIIQVANYAKNTELFSYPEFTEFISPESIIKQLEQSEIGIETISLIKEMGIKPILNYDMQIHNNRGEQIGNKLTIFIMNLRDSRVAAQTVIHEVTHMYYGIGGCQWAEAVCFAREKMFLTGKTLTVSERKYIINLAKQHYPEKKWKKGGYGYGTEFIRKITARRKNQMPRL